MRAPQAQQCPWSRAVHESGHSSGRSSGSSFPITGFRVSRSSRSTAPVRDDLRPPAPPPPRPRPPAVRPAARRTGRGRARGPDAVRDAPGRRRLARRARHVCPPVPISMSGDPYPGWERWRIEAEGRVTAAPGSSSVAVDDLVQVDDVGLIVRHRVHVVGLAVDPEVELGGLGATELAVVLHLRKLLDERVGVRCLGAQIARERAAHDHLEVAVVEEYVRRGPGRAGRLEDGALVAARV